MELINFTLLSDILINDIYRWRNNENVRYYCLNKNEISISEHIKFIKSLNNDISKKYFLAVLNDEPVGVISFTDINNYSANIGYYKNPFVEKKGIGTLLIYKACEYAINSLKLDCLIMNVYKHNDISIHCITKCGFIKSNINNDIIEYRLKLNDEIKNNLYKKLEEYENSRF